MLKEQIENKAKRDERLTSMPSPQGGGRPPKPAATVDDDAPELEGGDVADDGDVEYDGETGEEKYGARR